MSVTIDGLLGISKVAEEADVVHVGDFGVGGRCLAEVIDFNTYPDLVGVKGHLPYVVSENGSTNGPPNGGVFFFVQHFFYINGNCVQIAWPYYSNQSMWIRKRFNEVWTPWVQQYDQQSILGTVSQSAGVPTGAIIESGSNANGEYVKYADGTMICFNTSTTDTTGSKVVTFPAPFVASPQGISCIMSSGSPSTLTAKYTGLSTAGMTLYFNVVTEVAYSALLLSAGVTYKYIVIGRWF